MEFPCEKFATFVRSKPADERYDYCDPDICALGQFAIALGARPNASFMVLHDVIVYYPADIKYMAVHGPDRLNSEVNWTFGQLAERLAVMGL